MKKVVIEVRDGQAYVVSCSRNVEVIIKAEKKKPLHKRIRKFFRTILFHIKRTLRLV
jgi:hypothetical protein